MSSPELPLPPELVDMINQLNEEQLYLIQKGIDKLIELNEESKIRQILLTLCKGDIVHWERDGKSYSGTIIRINKKSITVIALDRKKRWRIHPLFLKQPT